MSVSTPPLEPTPPSRYGPRFGVVVLAILIGVAPAAIPNSYVYDVAILAGLNAIVCVALNLLIGYAGQISLGHAGFFGLGAYASAILSGQWGWPSLVSIPVAVLAVALVAIAIGMPILRLRGHYLAMATLGLGVIVSMIVTIEDRLTGGPDGMSVVPLAIGGLAVSGERAWYWIVAVALVAVVWLALNLIESPPGRALRALHSSELAAQTIGINVARQKAVVFMISAAVAALAGALTAHYTGFLTPAKVGFLHSIELVTMVVFGGLASIFGAVVGAIVLTALPQLLTVLKEYEMIVLGAVMMGTMIFMPRGVVPSLYTRFGGRP